MEKLQTASAEFETRLNTYAAPVKPYLPAIARFLLVATFLEDTIRIVTQWRDQIYYLEMYQGMPLFVVYCFLLTNITFMTIGSIGAITKKFPTVSIALLSAVVVLQSIGYGLLLDATFMLRNLSVLGGLLMLLSDALSANKRRSLFAGLPQLNEVEKTAYVQLAGRVLLVALVLSLGFAGEMTLFRGAMVVLGLGVSIMVVLGFKAKYSALLLVVLLSVGNVVLNNWWTLHHNHPERYAFLFNGFV
jgi:uncharacterized membrane protein YphA (DoxX/SURF4 family)